MTPRRGTRRRGRPWRRLRAYILATHPPVCTHPDCGQPIDLTLPGTHPDGPHVDHRTPVSEGGNEFDPTNCRVMHNRCNLKRGTKPDPIKASRTW